MKLQWLILHNNITNTSLLAWERGLKLHQKLPIILWSRVAPCVGAWIEIIAVPFPKLKSCVAPCVGAWIEIFWVKTLLPQASSLLAWERGLKLHQKLPIILWSRSLLAWERGLKYPKTSWVFQQDTSLLAWERGLK